jgi:ribA/ribD-fused uncharacterized protein
MVIYFYKISDPYGCFSNFSSHSIRLDGQFWPTVEHYYQAQKFVGTRDANLTAVIQVAPTALQAAELGRDCSRQLRPDWEQVKNQVMAKAVLSKFLIHADIQATLLETGTAELVEDSPTDYYWGCGQDRSGQNHLGKILMHVRTEIRDRYFVVTEPR